MKILSNIDSFQALKMVLILPKTCNVKQGSVSERNNIFLPDIFYEQLMIIAVWIVGAWMDKKDGNKHFLVSRRFADIAPWCQTNLQ